MKHIPKCDLHIHLGGSWPLEFLEAVADDPSDFSRFQSFLDQLHQKGDDTDYHICFEAFALASKIVNTIQKVQDGTCSMCRNFAEEGLCYMELRTGLKNIMDTGYEAYLQAVMRGIEQGCEGTPLKVAILLSLKRNSSRELAQETLRLIKKYRGKVVGLDVSDDALLPDASNIAEIIEEIHAQGIPVALHLGQSSFRIFIKILHSSRKSCTHLFTLILPLLLLFILAQENAKRKQKISK